MTVRRKIRVITATVLVVVASAGVYTQVVSQDTINATVENRLKNLEDKLGEFQKLQYAVLAGIVINLLTRERRREQVSEKRGYRK